MKGEKKLRKRKKSPEYSNGNCGSKETHPVKKITNDERDESKASSSAKRVKIAVVPESVTSSNDQHSSLDPSKIGDLSISSDPKTLNTQRNESGLSGISEGNDEDPGIIFTCGDIETPHNSAVFTQQKEEIIVARKSYITVNYLPSNKEITIDFDENDTVFILKQKIATQFQLDISIEDLELKIDSKLIDESLYQHSLESLNVSTKSSITINEKEKTKRFIKKNGLCGLRNLGSTCFMNSALQCLSNVELLTDYFLNLENVRGNVATAYYEFLQNVWSGQTLFVPKRLKNAIAKYAPQFADYDQEDAHEFMIFLLNQLHEDLKQEQQATTVISELFHGYAQGRTTCLTCKSVRSTSNMINFIPLPLDSDKKKRQFKINFESTEPISLSVETNANGLVEDIVEAFINKVQLQDDLFEHLTVVSPNSNNELSFDTSLNNILDTELTLIEQDQIVRKSKIKTNSEKDSFELVDCLREFIALETPNNLWFCKSKCNQPVHAAKQMLLSKLSPVLIIQLKRFTDDYGHMRKLTNFVNFPIHGLNLSEFMIDQQEKNVYDLTAVVNHTGTVNAGHYYAYARQIKTKPSEWFCFNDEIISSVDENDIVSSSAYLLIYVKREL